MIGAPVAGSADRRWGGGGLAVLAIAGAAAALAMAVSGLGAQGLLVVAGLVGMSVLMLLVRDRALAVLLILVLTVQFVLHKSIGPLNPDITGGTPSIYVTTLDVILVVLYIIWAVEGTIISDLRSAFRDPALLVPLVGGAAVLPSFLATSDVYLSVAELVRMLWLYLFFLYLAVRIRKRSDVLTVVGALFVVGSTQGLIALFQSATGSSLGLQVLGEDESLHVRALDGWSEISRASGTFIHPQFLATLTGPIGLLALSFAIQLTERRWRAISLAAMSAAFLAVVLSQSRSAILSAAIAAALLIGFNVWRGRISWRIPAAAVLVAALVVVQYRPVLGRFVDAAGTGQLQSEIQARTEMNELALRMFEASPTGGLGLNTYVIEMRRYDVYGLTYDNFAVHNWYLLVLAETGIIGLLGALVLLAGLFLTAIRLARTRDRIGVAVAGGALAMYVFFLVEELFSFSLREDASLQIFWLVAGLALACLRMARRGQAGAPARIAAEGRI